MTIDLQNSLHKDYIIKVYERLQRDEVEKYAHMIEKADKWKSPKH